MHPVLKLLQRIPLTLTVLAAGIFSMSATLPSLEAATKRPSKPEQSGSSTHTSQKSAAKSASSKSSRTKKTGKSSAHGKSSKKTKGQAAPSADRIAEIQSALARKGAYTGEPSGKWDDSTIEAMRKFQDQNGLKPTGRLDAPTLQKLGLGSEIAGVAAPTPPPGSVNRLRHTTSSPQEPSE